LVTVVGAGAQKEIGREDLRLGFVFTLVTSLGFGFRGFHGSENFFCFLVMRWGIYSYSRPLVRKCGNCRNTVAQLARARRRAPIEA